MDNIRIGKRDATDEEVRRVARLAQCDEFVTKMPQGYQTIIGENGETLSGGERQRISIARAILKNAPIIILDEATNGADYCAPYAHRCQCRQNCSIGEWKCC